MGELRRFDIVCRVVDNFGDAGVALRLGRQLHREHGLDVTLWIDDRARLARIAPGVDPALPDQRLEGVRIRALAEPMPGWSMPDVVIEAFGCGLPSAYVDAMQCAERKPVWIVLEYLSAERWVDDAHGLPSPHPQHGLERWFFFPGFTARTGGLIRERDLLVQRDAFLLESRSEHRAGDERLFGYDDALTVSLFCYANAALPALFETWAKGDESIRCIVPEGVAERSLDRFLSGDVPRAGERRHVGRLAIVAAPFVDQVAFDQRLWTSDVNIVRGEDSLLRALWAARPCCWHIYPQQQLAHVAKLEALLDRYVEGLGPSAAGAMHRFWIAFNDEDAARTAISWRDFRRALRGLQDHANRFAATLAQRPDLASELVAFARSRL